MSLKDFRQAIRRLRLAPGFMLAAVGSIALGSAGSVTVFSLVNAIPIAPKPMPISDFHVPQAATDSASWHALTSRFSER